MSLLQTHCNKTAAKYFLYCTVKYYFIGEKKEQICFCFLSLYSELNHVLLNCGPEITNSLDLCSFPQNVLVLVGVVRTVSGGLKYQTYLYSLGISGRFMHLM